MNSNFIESLISSIRHPRNQEKLIPYKGFIGSWAFDWVGHKEDGSTLTVPGEWHFSWILEGRAIQDVWICPRTDLRSSDEYPEGEYGITIRFYDNKENCIKIVYIGPVLSNLRVFKVSHTRDRIIQDETMITDKGKISRWEFKYIKEDSFKWESYISNDGRKTWRLDQEVYANRALMSSS
jgi:hypothetical protein